MPSPAPLFADDRTAAQLFCMKPKDFRDLVEAGHLPGPKNLGGFERWDMDELTRIARGEAAEGMGDVSW